MDRLGLARPARFWSGVLQHVEVVRAAHVPRCAEGSWVVRDPAVAPVRVGAKRIRAPPTLSAGTSPRSGVADDGDEEEEEEDAAAEEWWWTAECAPVVVPRASVRRWGARTQSLLAAEENCLVERLSDGELAWVVQEEDDDEKTMVVVPFARVVRARDDSVMGSRMQLSDGQLGVVVACLPEEEESGGSRVVVLYASSCASPLASTGSTTPRQNPGKELIECLDRLSPTSTTTSTLVCARSKLGQVKKYSGSISLVLWEGASAVEECNTSELVPAASPAPALSPVPVLVLPPAAAAAAAATTTASTAGSPVAAAPPTTPSGLVVVDLSETASSSSPSTPMATTPTAVIEQTAAAVTAAAPTLPPPAPKPVTTPTPTASNLASKLDPKRLPIEPAKFGQRFTVGAVLWLEDDPKREHGFLGSLELCEFRARIGISGEWNPSTRTLTLRETKLLAGKSSDWTCRFGGDAYVPGTTYVFQLGENPGSSEEEESAFPANELQCEFQVESPADKDTCGMIVRGVLHVQQERLFRLSSDAHGSFMAVSQDRSCVQLCSLGGESNPAGLALAEVGFSRGVHYWEVKVDSVGEEHGTVFVGVVERQHGPIFPTGVPVNNLNKWEKVPASWGFVNYRATQMMLASSPTGGTEQFYGEFFDQGDVVGVLLDMDMGEVSFFIDALKFEEHIMRDLGTAFLPYHLGSRQPVKWNPTGEMQYLYPTIGLKRRSGDAMSVSAKYVAFPSTESKDEVENMARLGELLRGHFRTSGQTEEASSDAAGPPVPPKRAPLPAWFVNWAYEHYARWSLNRYRLAPSRAGGRPVELDISPEAMQTACRGFCDPPLRAGERVRTLQSQGRKLAVPENAIVLGSRMGKVWYSIATVSNHEGLGDGATWAFYWEGHELGFLIRGEGGHAEPQQEQQHDEAAAPGGGGGGGGGAGAGAGAGSGARANPPSLPPPTKKSSHAKSGVLSKKEFAAAMKHAEDWTVEMDADLVKLVNHVLQRQGESDAMNLDFEQEFSLSGGNKSNDVCKARVSVLRLFNCMVKRALPFVMPPPSAVSPAATAPFALSSSSTSAGIHADVGAGGGGGACLFQWITRARRFVFTTTKRAFWEGLLKSTTTPTGLASEDYVDPPHIRKVCVNRIKAMPGKLAMIPSASKRLKRSVFGQLYSEMVKWPDSSFRRAYCGKGHGGQKRAFMLELVGEGVDDYGGPYRQAFEVVCDELQNDSEWSDSRRAALLPLLIPCPNRYTNSGDRGRDKFMLNPSAKTPSLLRRFEFLGKLIGTAVRHGLQLRLDLPALVWRQLVGLPVTKTHLEEIDVAFVRDLRLLEQQQEASTSFNESIGTDRRFQVALSDGSVFGDEDAQLLTSENCAAYVKFALNTRLHECDAQLAALKKGLGAVLPLEHFALFTGEELEQLVCGRPELDINLLQSIAEYEGGVKSDDPHVVWFWEVLWELSPEKKTDFLKFVWARSRMPAKAELNTAFHLQQPTGGAAETPDAFLPSAQTCFFSLALPKYTSKDILRSKFLTAIECTLMDADVRLRSAEGWAEI